MFRRITRWLDPILLIGLLVSVAVGVGMVLTGNDTLSGLTIGLLSTIVTLLIDAIARIQKAEHSFLEAAGLSRILSDESIGETLREMANYFEAIRKYNFDHYSRIAEIAIDECKTRLREISSGSVVVPSRTAQAYGYLGIQQARRDIKVIHIGSMDFWNSDFGRKYFGLNREAIKRGVQITRIFALTPEEARVSVTTLREQERAGIRVLVVRPDRVDHEFMIFDDRILVDFDVDEKGGYRLERVVLDPAQVRRKVEEFQHLVARYGKTIKEATSDV